MKKKSGILFLLFSTGFFLVASLSSHGGSSTTTSASIAVPSAPNPLPAVPPPPLLPRVAQTAPLSVEEIRRIIPVVEVWRANGQAPQIPARGRSNVLEAYVADSQPVTVRLQFDPAARGNAVLVRPGRGAVLDSPTQGLQINGNGECLLRLHLIENINQGHVAVHCGGVMTMVRLTLSSQARVLANENVMKGGLQ